jgi:hypothetical protein
MKAMSQKRINFTLCRTRTVMNQLSHPANTGEDDKHCIGAETVGCKTPHQQPKKQQMTNHQNSFDTPPLRDQVI